MSTTINGTTGIDKIQDGTVVDADIASLSASKLTGSLPALDGSSLTGVDKVLQVQQHFSNTKYSATTGSGSNGYPVLQKNLTTVGNNSSFLVQCITYIRSGIHYHGTNQDSADLHLGLRRTASGSTVAIGDGAYTRGTGNAPASGKFYSSDVPWLPNGDWTHAGQYDTFTRSHAYIDSPGLSAGASLTYELTAWWQTYIYVNRAAHSNSGGVSSMIIMEIAQ